MSTPNGAILYNLYTTKRKNFNDMTETEKTEFMNYTIDSGFINKNDIKPEFVEKYYTPKPEPVVTPEPVVEEKSFFGNLKDTVTNGISNLFKGRDNVSAPSTIQEPTPQPNLQSTQQQNITPTPQYNANQNIDTQAMLNALGMGSNNAPIPVVPEIPEPQPVKPTYTPNGKPDLVALSMQKQQHKANTNMLGGRNRQGFEFTNPIKQYVEDANTEVAENNQNYLNNQITEFDRMVREGDIIGLSEKFGFDGEAILNDKKVHDQARKDASQHHDYVLKRWNINKNDSDSKLGKFMDRIGQTGASVITGEHIPEHLRPTTGNKIADTVAGAVGTIGGFETPLAGLGANNMKLFEAGHQITNPAVKGIVEPITKNMNKLIKLNPDKAKRLVFVRDILPSAISSGATMSTVDAIKTLSSPDYYNMPIEKKAKVLGNSFLTGALFGGAIKVAEPYMSKLWLKKNGYEELVVDGKLNRKGKSKKLATGIWRKKNPTTVKGEPTPEYTYIQENINYRNIDGMQKLYEKRIDEWYKSQYGNVSPEMLGEGTVQVGEPPEPKPEPPTYGGELDHPRGKQVLRTPYELPPNEVPVEAGTTVKGLFDTPDEFVKYHRYIENTENARVDEYLKNEEKYNEGLRQEPKEKPSQEVISLSERERLQREKFEREHAEVEMSIQKAIDDIKDEETKQKAKEYFDTFKGDKLKEWEEQQKAIDNKEEIYNQQREQFEKDHSKVKGYIDDAVEDARDKNLDEYYKSLENNDNLIEWENQNIGTDTSQDVQKRENIDSNTISPKEEKNAVQELPLDKLLLMNDALKEKVNNYTRKLEESEAPPIDVYENYVDKDMIESEFNKNYVGDEQFNPLTNDDLGKIIYEVEDGNHRVGAYHVSGRKSIKANVLSRLSEKELEEAKKLRAKKSHAQEKKDIENFKKIKAIGKTTKAYTPDNRSIDLEYAVVDANDLTASHNHDLSINENYPQELQPRDRSRKSSELQISNILNKLNPELLGESTKVSDGSPIIGEDLVVESGNGRVLSLQRGYSEKNTNMDKYRKWLESNKDKFGIKGDVPENPVLVRVRKTDIDRADFTKKANEQIVSTMSSTEKAKQDAGNINDMLLYSFMPSEDGEIITKSNQHFIDGFLSQVIPEGERGNYVTSDGQISQDGARRIKNAILHKAYEDDSIVELFSESMDNNIKNVTNSMLQVAPRVVKIKNAIKNGSLHNLDITKDIANASKKFTHLKRNGESVENFLKQLNMFDEGMSSEAKEILNIFEKHNRSAKQLTNILNRYFDGLELAGHPNQVSMLKNSKPTKADLLEYALGGNINENQTSLFEVKSKDSKEVATTGESKEVKNQSSEKGSNGDERGIENLNKEVDLSNHKTVIFDNKEYKVLKEGEKRTWLIEPNTKVFIDNRGTHRTSATDKHNSAGFWTYTKDIKSKDEAPEPEVESTKDILDQIKINPDDINYEDAKRAYHWNSHFPEKSAKREQTDYVDFISSTLEELKEHAKTPIQKNLLLEKFKEFQKKYISLHDRYIGAKSRTASPAITGGSNFPVAKNNKALDVEHKRLTELLDYGKKQPERIKKMLLNARPEEEKTQERFNTAWEKVKKDIAIIKGCDDGKIKGYDKNLFKANLSKRIQTMFNSGDAELAKEILNRIKAEQENYKKPIFTGKHKIWKLLERETKPLVEEKSPEVGEVDFENGTISINDKDKLVISFDKEYYKNLPDEMKKEIKSNFLYSRKQGFVSRGYWRNKSYQYKKILEKHNMSFDKKEKVKEPEPTPEAPETIQSKENIKGDTVTPKEEKTPQIPAKDKAKDEAVAVIKGYESQGLFEPKEELVKETIKTIKEARMSKSINKEAINKQQTTVDKLKDELNSLVEKQEEYRLRMKREYELNGWSSDYDKLTKNFDKYSKGVNEKLKEIEKEISTLEGYKKIASEKSKSAKEKFIEKAEKVKSTTEKPLVKTMKFQKKLKNYDVSADEIKEQFKFMTENKDTIISDLVENMNKKPEWKSKRNATKLKRATDMWQAERSKLYYQFENTLSMKPMVLDFSGETKMQSSEEMEEEAIKEWMDNTLSDEYIQSKKGEAGEKLNAIKNPKTLEDFREASRQRELTPEEKDTYEDLTALRKKERAIEQAKRNKERKKDTAVKNLSDMPEYDIEKTTHSKTGEDIWVVKLKNQLEKDHWKKLNLSMKSLGGNYWRGNKGWNFKKDPTEILKGESKPEVKMPGKKNFEKLKEHAEKYEGSMKKTILNLADGIEKGEVKLLDKLQHMTEIDQLNSILGVAQYHRFLAEKRLNEIMTPEGSYVYPEKTVEDIRHAKFPAEKVYSDTLKKLVDMGKETKGAKLLANRINKLVNKTEKNDYVKLSNRNISDLKELVKKLTVAKKIDSYDYITDIVKNRSRLENLGIETEEDLRAYLREYLKFKKQDVKSMKDVIMQEKIERLKNSKIAGYFPTPKKIVQRMIDIADIKEGEKVLEPSAGMGHIADAIGAGKVDVAEWNGGLNEVLRYKGHNVIGDDALNIIGKYDKIIMNPPFEKGQDIEHVRHAFDNNLKNGGKLVAIMSEHPFFASDKKSKAFREWLDEVGGESEKLPEGAFKESDRKTGVNTRLVVIDKEGQPEKPKPSKKTKSKDGIKSAVNLNDVRPSSSKSGETKPLKEIIRDISKHFNTPVSYKRFRKPRASGYYEVHPENIALKSKNDLDVFSHEIGHHLDKKYSLSESNNVSDMVANLDEDFASNYEESELEGEAIAEFMRRFLINDSEAKSFGRKFYDEFTKSLSEEDLKVLNDAREDIGKWLNSSSAEKLKSTIVKHHAKKKLTKENLITDLRMKLFDEYHPIKQLVETAEKLSGKKIEYTKDAYMKAINQKNDDMITLTNVKDGLVDTEGNIIDISFKEVLTDIKDKELEDFDNYLKAVHSLDYMKQGKQVYHKFIENADIERTIKHYEENFPHFMESADKLHKWWDKFTDKWLVETGLLDKGIKSKMKEMYPHYVPNFRDNSLNEAQRSKYMGHKKGYANQKNPLKKSSKEGSGESTYSPIESFLVSMDKYIKTVKRREVMLAVHDLYNEIDGLGEYLHRVTPKMEKQVFNLSELKKKIIIDLARERYLSDSPKSELMAFDKMTKDEKIAYIKEMGWDDTPELIDKIVDNFHVEYRPQKINMEDEMITLVDRGGNVVHYEVTNPYFLRAMLNLSPKQLPSWLNAVGKVTRTAKVLITSLNPAFTFISNAPKDFLSAGIMIKRTKNQSYIKDYANAVKDIVTNSENFKGYKAVGGGFASRISADRNGLDEAMDILIPSRNKGLKGMIRKGVHTLENTSDAVESAPRLATFKRYDDGTYGGKVKGLYEASDVTLNFKRRGELAYSIEPLIYFYNAGMQEIDKLYRTAFKDKEERLSRIGRALTMLTIPTIILMAVNDDNENYKSLNNYTKDNFFCFPINGVHAKYPKNRAVATVFSTIIERTYRHIKGDKRAFKDFEDNIFNHFLPPRTTIVNPLIQAWANKDWRNIPIVSKRYEGRPDYLQYDDNTSEIAKAIGKVFDVAPKKIHYVIDQYTGIIGDIVLPATAKKKGSMKDFLKRKVIADATYSSESVNTFYDLKEQLSEGKKELGVVGKTTKPYSAGVLKVFNNLNKGMSAERKIIQKIKADKNISKDEKEKMVRLHMQRIVYFSELGINIYDIVFDKNLSDKQKQEKIKTLTKSNSKSK